MIILPRQARDKHRESTHKTDAFLQADIQMSFTFQPQPGDIRASAAAPMKFGVGVFCPPRLAPSHSIEALQNCTQVWFEVFPSGGVADGNTNGWNMTMSIGTAPDQFNHTAYNFTSAPFALPTTTPATTTTTINLRVLTDRSVVEAYAGACAGSACGGNANASSSTGTGAFDAVGQVAVEALAFPSVEATGVELFAAAAAAGGGATVGVEARAWSMGCGWVKGN